MEEKNKGKLQRFKDVLYSRSSKFSPYKRRKFKKNEIPVNLKKKWEIKDDVFEQSRDDLYLVKKERTPLFTILLVLATIFFVGAVSYAFFFLVLNQKEVKQQLDFSIIGPNTVASGEDFKFIVNVQNNTDFDFENISLSVSFPPSTYKNKGSKLVRDEIRDHKQKLLAGGSFQEKFNISLSGAVKDQKDIEVTLIYKASGYSNLISETKVYQLGIESSPVSLEIKYPQEVLTEREFDVDIDVLSNTNISWKDLILKTRLPQGFSFKESSQKPFLVNGKTLIFKIDSLDPGEKKTIKLTGSILGQRDEEKVFFFEIGDVDDLGNNIKTLFDDEERSLVIKRPDLQLDVAVNGEYGKEHFVQAGNRINVNLSLRNNLRTIVSDVRIEAKIEGENFEPKNLRTNNGYYDSNKNIIVWDKQNWEALKSLDGREQVKDHFSIDIKKLASLAGYQTNPNLKIKFKVVGTNFDSPVSQGEVVAEAETLIKTATYLTVASDIFYKNGPFENTGGPSPQVGKETTYTAMWSLTNSTNLLENIEVRAKLPYYVKFINNVSPSDYYLTYDKESREVIWRLKKLDPFIGYRTPPKTVYFQVSITPSANQSGKRLKLVGPKKVTATDTYIGTRIIAEQSNSDTTALENDASGGRGVGIVQPEPEPEDPYKN